MVYNYEKRDLFLLTTNLFWTYFESISCCISMLCVTCLSTYTTMNIQHWTIHASICILIIQNVCVSRSIILKKSRLVPAVVTSIRHTHTIYVFLNFTKRKRWIISQHLSNIVKWFDKFAKFYQGLLRVPTLKVCKSYYILSPSLAN